MATYTSWTHDRSIAEEYSGISRPGISIIFSATFNPEDILIDFSKVENFDRQRLSIGNRRKSYKEVLVVPGEYQVMIEHFNDTLEKRHPVVVSKNFGDNIYQSSTGSKISVSQSYQNIYHDYTRALAYANETDVICGPDHNRCLFAYTFSKKSDFILVNDETYNTMTNNKQHVIDEINQIIVERGVLDNERCIRYINAFVSKSSRDVNIVGFAFKTADGQYDYIICNPEKHLIRNYSSDVDWQYNPYLKSNSTLQDLFKIMRLFRTSNKSHSGDLYEHTVWCYLYTEDVMEVVDKDYFLSLSEVDRKFILVCSLLHDIGKMSRKDVKEHSDNTHRYYTYDTIEKHPEYGAEHIDTTKPSWSSSKTRLINGINIKKILLEIDPNFTTSHVQILKQCILYHWEFGDVLYNTQTNDIAKTYLGRINYDQFNDIHQQRLYVYCLLCLSISDILSRQPYTPVVNLGSADWRYVDNKVSKYIPSIRNVSKIRNGENYLSKTQEMIGAARNIFSQIE
jgi:putative nucleotidyltransferase with HDIG domain